VTPPDDDSKGGISSTKTQGHLTNGRPKLSRRTVQTPRKIPQFLPASHAAPGSKKIMLRNPNNSIVMVAVALGYTSQTAFAAAFRKLTGETPTDWRRRSR
jgi:methylphosphotriester-DNA--protein-cysteine methyltransferase